jgi:Cu-Zn family superoxide dismutase
MRILLAALLSCLVAAPAAAKSNNKLVVHLKTSAGQDAGTATFKQLKNGRLSIKLSLKNIPFGEHAVHIHEHPVCDAPDFKGAGGHFNPAGKQHGTLNPMGHHNGDLPQNISIGEDHIGEVSFKIHDLSLDPSAPDSILANGGTAIIVHERADDMKSDPTGNAGNRIACGVISGPGPIAHSEPSPPPLRIDIHGRSAHGDSSSKQAPQPFPVYSQPSAASSRPFRP